MGTLLLRKCFTLPNFLVLALVILILSFQSIPANTGVINLTLHQYSNDLAPVRDRQDTLLLHLDISKSKGNSIPNRKINLQKIGTTFTRKALEEVIPFGVGVVIGFSANKGLTWYVESKARHFFSADS